MFRILQIIPSLSKGGAERLLLDICNELSKRDSLLVKLIVLHPQNEYVFLSNHIDIELCRSQVIPGIRRKYSIDISDFEKAVCDFKPDIIHSHLFEAEMVSRWKLFPGIKYFTHCHDNMKQFRSFGYKTLLNRELFINYYERKIIMKRYKSCENTFIAISKDTEDYMKRFLPGKLKKNVFLLNNAIDYGSFKSEKDSIISTGLLPIQLISIGSLTEIKNHLFLIEVMKILKAKGSRLFHLKIIGEGPLRSSIEQKIVEYSLQSDIELLGIIDEVQDYLKEADLYVHSCKREGFGLTLLEAMASGLPVVCIDSKGIRDIIVEGKNGFMINEQDPDLFANKIFELIENKTLYSKMSLYSKEFVKKYDIKEYVDKLLEIYKNN